MNDDDFIELVRVHPCLSATVLLAARRFHVMNGGRHVRVTSGYRTASAQQRLHKAGVTPVLKSEHMDGKAVDLAILSPDRKAAIWDLKSYEILNGYMQKAWKEIAPKGILTWGGNWSSRDGVHWEIDLASVLPDQMF